MKTKKKLYSVEKLKVIFKVINGFVRAVEDIDIHVNEGESVAIVGESGCGKSVTALSVMKLLTTPPAIIKAEKMEFMNDDQVIDLTSYDEKSMQPLRGDKISMIFQDPQSTLNPVLTIGEQIDEVFLCHRKMTKKQAKQKTIEMLVKVGISSAEDRYSQFPHELSGGMKQRILIAMATALGPKLLIADEPTTALDVTVQAQILELLKDLIDKNNMAMLLITHDLGVVRVASTRLYVMYLGKIVEEGLTVDVLENPKHPYTKALLDTLPSLDDEIVRFVQIPKNVPDATNKPSGCYFSDRCLHCMDLCTSHMPPLIKIDENSSVRCWMRMDNEPNSL